MTKQKKAVPMQDEILTLDEIQDHILVRAWLDHETGRPEPDHCLSKVAPEIRETAAKSLVQKGCVAVHNGHVTLSAKGEEQARQLIRRHRLAERLFAVVFNLSEEAVHAQACRMEHEKVLTPEAVERICFFFFHPPFY